MAGNYFHDPRPFYGMTNYNLMPLDEVFYGRDPWFAHQIPYGPPAYGIPYYGDPRPRSRSVEHRRPGEYVHSEDQFREYRRPDMRDDTYTNYHQGYDNRQEYGRGNEMRGNMGQKNSNGGGKHSNNDNNSVHKKNRQNDSDDDDSDGQSGKKNKGNKNQSHNAKSVTWSDNQGFHSMRGHGHHRRHKSPSLKDVVLRKLGLKDDSSDSDEDYGIQKKSTRKEVHGQHGGHRGYKGQSLTPYTVNFGDQSHGGRFQKQYHLEDSNSHGKKGGGGQVQSILKKSKNDDGSDDENRGHKNQGGGKGGNHHDGSNDSGKKNGQSNQKQLGRSQSMDFRVRLCCDNCERKVRHTLRNVDDINEVHCDQYSNRVTVLGNAKPEQVLKRLRKVKKETQLWQQYK